MIVLVKVLFNLKGEVNAINPTLTLSALRL